MALPHAEEAYDRAGLDRLLRAGCALARVVVDDDAAAEHGLVRLRLLDLHEHCLLL